MGLEPHGIISDSDTNEHVEAHEDSRVVPKSVTIPGKHRYASFEAYKHARVVPKSLTVRRKRKYASFEAYKDSRVGKCQYQSASSVLHSSSSVTSSVADVASVTTDAKVASSQQATAAAVEVVASMHSYAIPGYIRRPTKFTAGSSSGDTDNKTSNNASNAVVAVKRPVSVCCVNV